MVAVSPECTHAVDSEHSIDHARARAGAVMRGSHASGSLTHQRGRNGCISSMCLSIVWLMQAL